MRPRALLLAVGLGVVFAGSVWWPLKGAAQEASAGVSKRRVRRDVQPVYPALAREMHVVGKVKIEATIDGDGRVVDTKVVGGSPLLVNAALDAIRQWRFEPGPAESTETFIFDFDKPD